MEERIYLVKGKGLDQYGQEVWLQMNGQEFYKFLHSEEGKERYFIHLVDDISYGADIYIEASRTEYQAWKKEENRRICLKNWRKKKTILSLDGTVRESGLFFADIVGDDFADPEKLWRRKLKKNGCGDGWRFLKT